MAHIPSEFFRHWLSISSKKILWSTCDEGFWFMRTLGNAAQVKCQNVVLKTEISITRVTIQRNKKGKGSFLATYCSEICEVSKVIKSEERNIISFMQSQKICILHNLPAQSWQQELREWWHSENSAFPIELAHGLGELILYVRGKRDGIRAEVGKGMSHRQKKGSSKAEPVKEQDGEQLKQREPQFPRTALRTRGWSQTASKNKPHPCACNLHDLRPFGFCVFICVMRLMIPTS